jgi:two-component system sensor histidine kinase KdpD
MNEAPALGDVKASDGPGTLLVCVMADGQAGELVRHGQLLSNSLGMDWRVVYLETRAAHYASDTVRQELKQALQHAEQHRAEVLRLSLEIDSASRIVSTIVQQAQSLQATHILLGHLAAGRHYGFNFGERISDFAETLVAYLPSARIHILARPGKQTPETPPPELAEETGHGQWPRQAGMALGVLTLCTALSALIAPYLHPINLLLIFMVGVLYVALRSDSRSALLTMLLAVLIFDWIFVAPRWSLKPTDPEYFFTFLITFGVGLAVNRLATQARQTARHAMIMARHSQSLSLLSQSLARALTTEEIARAVTSTIERDLGGQARLLLLDDRGHFPEAQANPHDTVAARAVLDTTPLPAGQQGFALAVGGSPLGVLLVQGLPGTRQTASELHLLQAYANQAAVAIERNRYARQSEQAAIAAEAERIRNTLLAGISHDFRTPLTAIIGAASAVLSQGRAISLEQRNVLAQSVLDQATRLQSLTSDLLDLARLQDGRVRPQPEWCPADDLVHDAVAAVAGALDHHVLALQVEPEDVVWCDATLMVQALANLLLNAARHSLPGSRIDVAVQLGTGDCLLRVRDQGPGLRPGTEREVFKKFYRDGAAGTQQGTGLGLAICEVVVRLHDGHIVARSEGGAVFEITLPQPPRPPAPEEALDG